MRCRLILDSEGPNPAFAPPDPRVDPIGHAVYDVPHTITVPAGTELPESRLAWVHCVPDASGVIRAEPADDQCAAAVERRIASEARGRKVPVETVRADHARRIAAAKAQQARSKSAPAASEAAPSKA